MQTEKKIYIGLVVLLVLGGLLYLQMRKSKQDVVAHTATTVSSASMPAIKLPDDDVDKVTKVAIKAKDKDDVVLEKRGDKWFVTKPVDALASQQNVKSMLDNLKALEVQDSINDTPEAPKMYKDYELDDASATHVTAFKGDKGADKAFEAYFGKSGSRGQMARIADKPGIWVVKGYSSFQFTRALKDWREKSVLKFEDKNVVSVAITNEEGEFSFSFNDDTWSGTFKKKKIDRFDPDKVKDMLRAFRALNAEDFADDKKDKAEETGLDKPAGTIVITLKDEAGTHTLTFGKTSTGSSRYAKKNDDPMVYVMGSWASDWAVAKVEKFQKPDEKDKDKDKKPPMPPGMPGMPGMPPGMVMPDMPEE
jgi:hypothetical protein